MQLMLALAVNGNEKPIPFGHFDGDDLMRSKSKVNGKSNAQGDGKRIKVQLMVAFGV
jgi:hypothetical protein